MREQETGGMRCALCGALYIGAHACSTHPVLSDPPRFTLNTNRDDATMREILTELKAIRALLEARAGGPRA